MFVYQGKHRIQQLESRKGGYFYVKIDAEIVNDLSKKRATRIICTFDDDFQLQCGLNHLGDGNYFIIISKKNLGKIGKEVADEVQIDIEEDPNPLGVEIPEVLHVFLAQDEDGNAIFEQLTDGRKRTLIHKINRIKNIDLQIKNILEFLEEEQLKMIAKNKK